MSVNGAGRNAVDRRRRHRVLFLTGLDLSRRDGQSIYALRTFDGIAGHPDLRATLLAPKPPDPGELLAVAARTGAKLSMVGVSYRTRSARQHLVVQLRLLIQGVALLWRGRQDAVVYSLRPYMIAPLVLAWLFRLRRILLVEGMEERNLGRLVGGRALRSVGYSVLQHNIRKADFIYAAYPEAQRWMVAARAPGATRVVPCGVDIDLFRPVRATESRAQLTVGYVGSFRHIHLVDVLLEAARDMPVGVILVGGVKESSVQELFSLPNVAYLGERPQAALPAMFSDCDVMWGVTALGHWGIPIKCFEYLACNKKVIYRDCPELQFITEEGFGYSMANPDVSATRELLGRLIEDRQNGSLADNTDARAYVGRNYSWDAFGRQVAADLGSHSRSRT